MILGNRAAGTGFSSALCAPKALSSARALGRRGAAPERARSGEKHQRRGAAAGVKGEGSAGGPAPRRADASGSARVRATRHLQRLERALRQAGRFQTCISKGTFILGQQNISLDFKNRKRIGRSHVSPSPVACAALEQHTARVPTTCRLLSVVTPMLDGSSDSLRRQRGQEKKVIPICSRSDVKAMTDA
ncbi:Protein of unknown function [Gryllus bimaculatus]|nr:Protein of unknown function [Gryllus bimaculatus]